MSEPSPVKARPRPRRKRPGAFHHGDLRAQLLLAAEAVVAVRGHEGLTLHEVARRVGVTEPAVYRHFAHKAALLAAVATRGFVDFQRALVVAASSTTEPRDAVAAIGRAYVRHAHAHAGWFRLWFSRARTEGLADLLASAPGDGDGDTALLLRPIERLAPDAGAALDVFRALWAQWHGLAVFVIERVFQLVDSDAARLAAADAAIDVVVDALAAAARAGPSTR
jgi:AcrR family transcriptional regulator